MERHGEAGTVIICNRSFRLNSTFRRFLLSVLSLAAFALIGCASSSDMETTKSSMAQLQVRSASQDRDIAQLKEQLASMSRDTGSITAIKESQSSLLSQMNDYSKDLQALRGRFDENKYFLDKTVKDLMAENELQKARITALENQLKASQTPPPAQPTAQKEAPKTNGQNAEKAAEAAPKAPEDAAKLYDEAHIAYKNKKYAEARKMFERFVKDYPKESLTPNSYFWIGETYYAEKKYEDAILAYEDFLKKYPNNEKARGAMLKQGYSFLELGDKKTGKVILETLIEKYPKSKEADAARNRLKNLSPQNSKTKKKKR